jgi:hypothetical protein
MRHHTSTGTAERRLRLSLSPLRTQISLKQRCYKVFLKLRPACALIDFGDRLQYVIAMPFFCSQRFADGPWARRAAPVGPSNLATRESISKANHSCKLCSRQAALLRMPTPTLKDWLDHLAPPCQCCLHSTVACQCGFQTPCSSPRGLLW